MAAKKKPREKRTRFAVDERRAQLIALGIQRFSRQPYDDVSIDEIAEAAGISKGLLYHYFPTKRAFYVATLKESSKNMRFRTTPDPNLPPLERAQAGISAYLQYVEEHAQSFTGLLRGGIGADKEVARIVDDMREHFISIILENSVVAAGLAGPQLEKLRAFMRGWVGYTEAMSVDYLERKILDRQTVVEALVRMLVTTIQLSTQI